MTAGLDGREIVLGVTGSIAAYKAVLLLRELTAAGARVTVCLSGNAKQFVAPLTFRTLSGNPVTTSLWEPENPYDEPHVVLGEQASLFVIAPATAQTLARLALGLADDPVSATALVTRAPILLAPAMHESMFAHPATQEHLRILRDRGCRIIGPETGWLAAGRKGMGRMSEPETIIEEICAALDLR
jgi:phosphopantothenoylcysteine decarboxylase/phosphopantothenate--cysteine ligase